MPVVSNTSPLLNLAIISRLSLLREQFGEIRIPPAVLEELRVEEDLPGSQAVREAIKAGWLRVRGVKDQPFVQVLQRDLGEGEAEIIALTSRRSWCCWMSRKPGRLPSCTAYPKRGRGGSDPGEAGVRFGMEARQCFLRRRKWIVSYRGWKLW